MLMTQRFASGADLPLGTRKYSGWRTGVSRAGDDTTPTLLLQAEEERVVETACMTVFVNSAPLRAILSKGTAVGN